MYLYSSIVTHILIAFLYPLNVKDNWVLKKNAEGIKVYTRDVPGLRVRSFKGVTRLNASVSELVALMKDVENGSDWIYECKTAKLLESVSFWEQYNYYVIRVPGPFQNRDIVMHLTMKQDTVTGSVTITIENAEDFVPKKDNLFRVPALKGYWKFVPISEKTVEVTYQLNVDPGGNIPAFLANMRAVRDPFHTLKGLKTLVRKGNYRNAEFSEMLN